MAWTSLANALFLVGKPITSSTGIALRDNPSAIAEGASGAPRIMDAALGTTPTTAGKNWVTARNALATPGDVGTYLMLSVQTAPSTAIVYSPGVGALGTDLKYATATGTLLGGSPAGKWYSAGYAIAGPTGTYPLTDDRRITMWLRFE
jgi:hypothetical protein